MSAASNQARRAPMPDEFYTVEEMAQYLKISEQTIRAWIRARKVSAVKLGRSWRIPRPEVERVATEGVPENGEDATKQ